MSLIDMNGLMSRRALGSRREATREAGPEPIDLPKRMIWLWAKPCTMVR